MSDKTPIPTPRRCAACGVRLVPQRRGRPATVCAGCRQDGNPFRKIRFDARRARGTPGSDVGDAVARDRVATMPNDAEAGDGPFISIRPMTWDDVFRLLDDPYGGGEPRNAEDQPRGRGHGVKVAPPPCSPRSDP